MDGVKWGTHWYSETSPCQGASVSAVKISGGGSMTVRVASEWSGGKVSLTQILYLQELKQP